MHVTTVISDLSKNISHRFRSFSNLLLAIGPPELVEMLIDHGADVNAVEGVERETALHTVIRSPVLNNSDTVSIIKLLLKNGANVNVENKYHQSPLGIAYNDEGMSET